MMSRCRRTVIVVMHKNTSKGRELYQYTQSHVKAWHRGARARKRELTVKHKRKLLRFIDKSDIIHNTDMKTTNKEPNKLKYNWRPSNWFNLHQAKNVLLDLNSIRAPSITNKLQPSHYKRQNNVATQFTDIIVTPNPGLSNAHLQYIMNTSTTLTLCTRPSPKPSIPTLHLNHHRPISRWTITR